MFIRILIRILSQSTACAHCVLRTRCCDLSIERNPVYVHVDAYACLDALLDAHAHIPGRPRASRPSFRTAWQVHDGHWWSPKADQTLHSCDQQPANKSAHTPRRWGLFSFDPHTEPKRTLALDRTYVSCCVDMTRFASCAITRAQAASPR